MSTCKSCKAEIKWVKTASGKNMPVNGNPAGELFKPETMISHFATCKDADKFRKKKG